MNKSSLIARTKVKQIGSINNYRKKEHTGLVPGKPGDRNSPAPDIELFKASDLAEIVESGTIAEGTAEISVGGKLSMGGICDIGTDVFLGMMGELVCDDPPE